MTQAVQHIQGGSRSSYDETLSQINERINTLSTKADETNQPVFNYGQRNNFEGYQAHRRTGFGAKNAAEAEAMGRVGIYNRREFGAYRRAIDAEGRKYQAQRVTCNNIENMKELASRFDEHRTGGVKYINAEKDTQILREALQSGNGISLYLANCGLDGFKNPNLPLKQRYSFENLKNPTKLVKTLQSHTFNTPDANEDINLLTDIALKQKSPEMAACLLEGTRKGGTTGHGVDEITAQRILIDSRKMFSSDAEYKKFITDIDKSYKKIFNKSLDKYVEENYKMTGQIASAGVFGVTASVASRMLGKRFGLLGSAGAAVAGGLLSYITYHSNILGDNEKGEELKNVLDTARAGSDEINMSDRRFGRFSRAGR